MYVEITHKNQFMSQELCKLRQYWLWSFQGRVTKLERFLANQLWSNEKTKFGELE